jgi:hypothetical protein
MARRPWSDVVRALARVWARPEPPAADPTDGDGDDDDFDDPLLRAVAAAPEIPLRPPAAQWLPEEATPPKRRS